LKKQYHFVHGVSYHIQIIRCRYMSVQMSCTKPEWGEWSITFPDDLLQIYSPFFHAYLLSYFFMNSLQEKWLTLYLCLYPQVMWNNLRDHFEIVWSLSKMQQLRRQRGFVATLHIHLFVIYLASCSLINKRKEETSYNQNKKLPLGMPDPLVQIPTASKLQPVERRKNFNLHTNQLLFSFCI